MDGKVKEVFMANKRNRQGKRYGFVRFAGEKSSTLLEKELGSICIGNRKIHVNIPRFNRRDDPSHRVALPEEEKIGTKSKKKKDFVVVRKQVIWRKKQ